MRSLSAYILSAMLLGSSLTAQASVTPVESVKPLKVLIHVDDRDDMERALGNAENLIKAMQPSERELAKIELVLNGNAVSSLDTTRPNLQSFTQYMRAAYRFVSNLFAGDVGKPTKTTLARLQELSSRNHVRVIACSNSLKGMNIDRASLPSYVDVVPAGVMELSKKGNEGYAYIKP